MKGGRVVEHLVREVIGSDEEEKVEAGVDCQTRSSVFQVPVQLLRPRSLKSVLVLPPQIFGPFGPPKKRVNFDKFNQRHISA